ncbi:hypothetical protein NLG97_g5674 [Lecanicillium saksenae]|uniref:Uncharacterized protein n=1 Tax=Lecanicillium saksenae TaxID=468837 RepID=A0ACC1QRS7_9HYPO|nr:hypothetical protein NLG97_g5674 [Lecanicillium saksenae]
MSDWSSAPDAPFRGFECDAAINMSSENPIIHYNASSSSFLNEIKKLVLPTSGPCPFTQDQSRVGPGSNARLDTIPNHVSLPNQETAEHLVDLASQQSLLNNSGNEQVEPWKVQAWSLMATYYLASSHWETADSYMGLAVKAAHKLELNRSHEPCSPALGGTQMDDDDAKLLKCVFVLDSFVAALAGRQPQATTEEECSPRTLGNYNRSSVCQDDECLDFNVASAKAIRKSLELVYRNGHFPAEAAFKLLQHTQSCSPSSLNCDGGEYAVMFRDYATMILTRMLFLEDLSFYSRQKCLERSGNGQNYFSQMCVDTAQRTVEQVCKMLHENQDSYNDYMWRPCLFTAVLILLTNQYFDFYTKPDLEATLSKAFEILERYAPRSSSEKIELQSLFSLHRLVEDRKQRPQPFRPYVNLDRYHITGAAVKREDNSPLFAPDDFAAANRDPAPSGNIDERRVSTQSSLATSDYMEPENSPSAHIGGWNLPSMEPSFNFPRCGSDACFYGFPAQQGVYDSDFIQVSPEFTSYPEHQLYRS